MREGWKRVDLEGGGLQAANLRLAAVLKRRPRAYGLLALFPLGLHRAYLEDRRGAWLYRAASALAAAAFAFGPVNAGWAVVAVLAGAAAYDVFWIERRIVRVNKRLRVSVWLGGASAPADGRRGLPAGGIPPCAPAGGDRGSGPADRPRDPTAAQAAPRPSGESGHPPRER